eukprot:jgi/Bigna1/77898/fgenesh1_pg.51_\
MGDGGDIPGLKSKGQYAYSRHDVLGEKGKFGEEEEKCQSYSNRQQHQTNPVPHRNDDTRQSSSSSMPPIIELQPSYDPSSKKCQSYSNRQQHQTNPVPHMRNDDTRQSSSSSRSRISRLQPSSDPSSSNKTEFKWEQYRAKIENGSICAKFVFGRGGPTGLLKIDGSFNKYNIKEHLKKAYAGLEQKDGYTKDGYTAFFERQMERAKVAANELINGIQEVQTENRDDLDETHSSSTKGMAIRFSFKPSDGSDRFSFKSVESAKNFARILFEEVPQQFRSLSAPIPEPEGCIENNTVEVTLKLSKAKYNPRNAYHVLESVFEKWNKTQPPNGVIKHQTPYVSEGCIMIHEHFKLEAQTSRETFEKWIHDEEAHPMLQLRFEGEPVEDLQIIYDVQTSSQVSYMIPASEEILRKLKTIRKKLPYRHDSLPDIELVKIEECFGVLNDPSSTELQEPVKEEHTDIEQPTTTNKESQSSNNIKKMKSGLSKQDEKSKGQENEEFEQFLKEACLSEYVKTLRDGGYEYLEDLSDMESEEIEKYFPKTPHRRRFEKAIKEKIIVVGHKQDEKSKGQENEEFEQFLKEACLSEYVKTLRDGGYEYLEDLSDMESEEIEKYFPKKPHRRRFEKAIKEKIIVVRHKFYKDIQKEAASEVKNVESTRTHILFHSKVVKKYYRDLYEIWKQDDEFKKRNTTYFKSFEKKCPKDLGSQYRHFMNHVYKNPELMDSSKTEDVNASAMCAERSEDAEHTNEFTTREVEMENYGKPSKK